MTGARVRASDSRSAKKASSVSRLTRQTPFLPIFRAGRSPERMSVYTWVTVTLSTRATSAGFRSGAGRSSNGISLTSVASDLGQLRSVVSNSLPSLARAAADGRTVAS